MDRVTQAQARESTLMSAHGFRRVAIGEHDFAKFLRKHKAIDNYQSTGTANTWYGPDGRAVAQCHYDNATCETVYWIRSDIAPKDAD